MNIIAVVQAALLVLSMSGAAQAADKAVDKVDNEVANEVAAKVADKAGGNGAFDSAGAPLVDACYLNLARHGCGRANHGVGPPSYQVPFGEGALSSPGMARFDGFHGDDDAGVFVDNISVQTSVPEPSNYSMLLIGLLLLVVTSRGHATEKFGV